MRARVGHSGLALRPPSVPRGVAASDALRLPGGRSVVGRGPLAGTEALCGGGRGAGARSREAVDVRARVGHSGPALRPPSAPRGVAASDAWRLPGGRSVAGRGPLAGTEAMCLGVRRVAPGVWSIGILLPFPVHAWLVAHAGALTLVDGGLAMMGPAIVRTIAATGLPLRQVVLTHGHFDHVGGLRAVLARWPVPTLAHPEELPCLLGRRGYAGRPAPGRPLVEPSLLRALQPGERPGGLEPRHCPGHTPGHTAYWLPGEDLLIAGDLFSAYLPGRLGRPTPFLTDDMAQAVESGALVEELRPERMLVCHGGLVRQPHRLYPAYRRRHLGR